MFARALNHPLKVASTLAVLVVASAAWAADARLAVAPAIYEVDKVASRTHMALTYERGSIVVHVGGGPAGFPQVNLAYAGDIPKDDRERVVLADALHRTTGLRAVHGGVVVEHHKTTVATLRDAYVATLADLGFTYTGSPNGRTWHFVNGTERLRVNAMPFGQNVTVYIGR